MNLADKVDAIPSHAELVARARALVPVLAERAAQTEQDRIVPKASIDELQAAGFFRVLGPKRWGGYELGLEVANDIAMILAEGCMSTAWVYAVLAVEPFLIALFDERVAQDVWGNDPAVLVCGTSAGGPGNKAVPVEGGFRVTGRWRFASGCDHTEWTFLGGCHVADPAGTSAEWRMLLPRSDYQIVDTWQVAGLRGTGSRDLVVEDAFVPAYRAIKQLDLFNGTGPGQTVNTAPLFRIPFGQLFALSVSTLMLGGLQGMLDAYLAYGRKRIARGIGPTAQDPVAQLLCAEIAVTIAECKLAFNSNIAKLTEYAQRGESAPLQERMQYKFQTAYAVERASLLAARLFKAAGASGIYVETSPFGRFLADINVGRQHVNNQYEPAGRNWGRMMLGGNEADNRDIFL
jgi:3-hydroxy-9,10-secoandrosta-1,3,5(10)-triene-9,17-dione monooxygenase